MAKVGFELGKSGFRTLLLTTLKYLHMQLTVFLYLYILYYPATWEYLLCPDLPRALPCNYSYAFSLPIHFFSTTLRYNSYIINWTYLKCTISYVWIYISTAKQSPQTLDLGLHNQDNQDNKLIYHPQKFPHDPMFPFYSDPPPPTHSQATLDLFLSLQIHFCLLEFYVKGII